MTGARPGQGPSSTTMRSTRRALLGLSVHGLLGLVARGSRAEAKATPSSADVEVRDLREGGRRFTLVVPRHLAPGEKVPLVVLLHGLGETTDERSGAFAWIERYGLVSAYERLRRPPVTRTSRRRDLTEPRAGELSSALAARPFGGLVLACPYMPNLAGNPSGIDAYGRWLVDALVPRARREAPTQGDDRRVGIGGCSLGGTLSLGVFLRHPGRFGAWGGLQTAIGEASAGAYAIKLAALAHGGAPPRLQLLSSTEDPFRRANEALGRALARRGVAHDLRVPPGPHDQPWLREAGTLESLFFFDAALR